MVTLGSVRTNVCVDEQPPAPFGHLLAKGSDNIGEKEVDNSATASKKVHKNRRKT